jgi:hypothetical protein
MNRLPAVERIRRRESATKKLMDSRGALPRNKLISQEVLRLARMWLGIQNKAPPFRRLKHP